MNLHLRYFAAALFFAALTMAPGCGGGGHSDESAVVAPEPVPGPGPTPEPEPQPEPDPEPDPVPTWVIQLEGNGNSINSLSAVDASHAWALTFGAVLRTQDGGATWTPLAEGNVPRPSAHVMFLDTSHGWGTSSSNVLRTSDGGESWTSRLALPFGVVQWWSSMSFVSATTGWVAEYHGNAFYRTTDGGDAWTSLELPPGRAPRLKFVDDDHGWVSLTDDSATTRLYGTFDGGATWEQQFELNNYAFVSDLEALNADEAWALINDQFGPPTLMRTTNGGATWTSTVVPEDRSLCFINASAGWLVGESGVYHSTDGGTTWTPQPTPSLQGGPYLYNYFSDVRFVNSMTGWATGGYGTNINGHKGFIMKSTIGGD